MILVGLISNDELIHQQIKTLLLYNRKYSISFACASFITYKNITDDKKNADIIIIDGCGDKSDMLYAIKHLNKPANSKIITITVNNDPGTTLQMIKAGATGFLISPFNDAKFQQCLQNTIEEKSFIDEGLLYKVFDIMHSEVDSNHDMLLSEREFEIIKLISKGCRNKEIGELLHISHHTVNQHLKKIYRKFDVNSRGRLIHKLIEINHAK